MLRSVATFFIAFKLDIFEDILGGLIDGLWLFNAILNNLIAVLENPMPVEAACKLIDFIPRVIDANVMILASLLRVILLSHPPVVLFEELAVGQSIYLTMFLILAQQELGQIWMIRSLDAALVLIGQAWFLLLGKLFPLASTFCDHLIER